MTVRCTQCGWRLRDADEVHGTLLDQVEAMLQGIVDKRVDANTSELRAQLIRARRELGDARLYADKVADDRDAARSELAGVAAQRDAQLVHSMELASRITELEARTFDVARLEQDNAGLRSALASEARKAFDMRAAMDALEARLAALTPAAPVEVDGFRVGDIVRHRDEPRWGAVYAVDDDRVQYAWTSQSGLRWHMGRGMVRKPVEVGDTVRVTRGIFQDRRGELVHVDADEAAVELADCIVRARLADLVAVAT